MIHDFDYVMEYDGDPPCNPITTGEVIYEKI